MKRPDIIERLRDFPYPRSEYWIITGGAMVLYGIREETGDVDMGCTSAMADCLEAEGHPSKRMANGNRSFQIGDEIEIFENWLCGTVVRLDGIPVISIDGLVEIKRQLGREKDLRDIELIERYRSARAEAIQMIGIRKASITDLDTDAVVNAANEGLRAGSGVCGAIFDAAGKARLQAACDRIGHCDTGSAVITPGFGLRAKYIIHAVGPVWAGGDRGEAELLYGAYARSLELAKENGCRSVGFPLISAGIFGYPTEEAWDVALRACIDFLAAGNRMEVVFAVLSERNHALGSQALRKLADQP